MKKAIMVQGTGSGAGKSLLVTGLCRIFSDRGIKVAPFKAQNMALNSYITKDGGEIGRAQALQAEAARVEPSVDMNPVLLKASAERFTQVIIQGRVYGNLTPGEYYRMRERIWDSVTESYDRLSSTYELIVIEGAGSPAEINLRDVEIVNMAIARHAGAPVVLVGDIDRGGVFASLYGTVGLLEEDSKYIKAFVINKFRGDRDILLPGLMMLEEKTGIPVAGVIPFIEDLGLPEEDSLGLYSRGRHPAVAETGRVRVVVLALPYVSNFTDFDPFLFEPDVELIYTRDPADIENADIVILPGTKSTIKDLKYLTDRGLHRCLENAFHRGIQIIGICGGYQLLGQRIEDPEMVESVKKEARGLGLLPVETRFRGEKTTTQAIAHVNNTSLFKPLPVPEGPLRGYEIHMGESSGDVGLFRVHRTAPHINETTLDGATRGSCWGTYLHGLFDNDHLRRTVINMARMRKGLQPVETGVCYNKLRDRAIQKLAEVINSHIDMDLIWRLLDG